MTPALQTDPVPRPADVDAAGAFVRLSRQLMDSWIDLWVGLSDEAVRRGFERRQIVIDSVRGLIDPSPVPSAVSVSNWWLGTVAGLPGASLDALHRDAPPAPAVPAVLAPTTEVDLTDVNLTDADLIDLGSPPGTLQDGPATPPVAGGRRRPGRNGA